MKINHYFEGSLVAKKKVALGKRPKEELIDVPFNVTRITHKDTGDWVALAITGRTVTHDLMFDGAVLKGLDKSPVITDATGKEGLDEDLRFTWTKSMEEPEFK
jgi:hypothetical protein